MSILEDIKLFIISSSKNILTIKQEKMKYNSAQRQHHKNFSAPTVSCTSLIRIEQFIES